MTRDTYFHYDAKPLENVWLTNGYSRSETAWGMVTRYEDLPGLAAAILFGVISKPSRLNGNEILYLRIRLDLPQSECADLLSIDAQTLSLWERGRHRIPVCADAVFRMLCVEKLRNKMPRIRKAPKASDFLRFATRDVSCRFVATFEKSGWLIAHDQIQDATTNYLNSSYLISSSDIAVLGEPSAPRVSILRSHTTDAAIRPQARASFGYGTIWRGSIVEDSVFHLLQFDDRWQTNMQLTPEMPAHPEKLPHIYATTSVESKELMS